MPASARHGAMLDEGLRASRVFGQLDAAARHTLARQFETRQARPGNLLLAQGQLPRHTALVLSGTVEMRDPDLGTAIQLGTGELFGLGATPPAQLLTWQATALTDCTLAQLPPAALVALCQAQPQLAYFLPSLPSSADAEPPGITRPATPLNLLATPVGSLPQRPAVTVPPETSIQDAAAVMRDQKVSSLLLVEQGLLFGLITDRDLRERVVAEGLDTALPVADIATLAPLTLDARSPGFEALLLMARHNIHHVPVMNDQSIVGMVTARDVTERQSTSAVYLAGDIHRQTEVGELVRISQRIPALLRTLVAADASAYSAGHIVTTITDALTTRLIQLTERDLGPAPVDYVWAAAGSQARNEQTGKSDQDNCLILDNRYDPAAHGEYFRLFSRQVCDGLAECGYVHCPGEMMAMNEAWRQPVHRWEQLFQQWIDEPEPAALMLTCVFFDLRAVYGKTPLLNAIRRQVLERTRNHSLFLAYMVGNALKHRPPTGLFGNIAPVRGGPHAGTIDLKHTAIVPIVDLARIFALAGAIEPVNTHDRLAQAGRSGEVSPQSAHDLRDALEFLGRLRLAHQARQMARRIPPDNLLPLKDISHFERSQLKDAFGVISGLQSVLGQRYQVGRF